MLKIAVLWDVAPCRKMMEAASTTHSFYCAMDNEAFFPGIKKSRV
jgi:hypothetical protein